MEFSSIWYFSFWSLVSLVFSATGIYALRKATIPVSDLVKIQYENFIVFSISFSTYYAFLVRPALEPDQDLGRYLILTDFYLDMLSFSLPTIYFCLVCSGYFTILGRKWNSVLLLVAVFSIPPVVVKLIRKRIKYFRAMGNLLTAFAGPLIMYPYHTLCCALYQGFLLLLRSYTVLGLGKSESIFPLLSFLSSAYTPSFYFSILITTSFMAVHLSELEIIEFVVGILGTILAQYYLRFKSMSLMLGLFSWAIAWLGILANVQPNSDFGIFHFLVIASLECAVSLFGLHFYTFLVGCGAFILMVLRWKMKFVSLRHSNRLEIVEREWQLWKKLYGYDSSDSSIQNGHPEQLSEGASNTQRLGIQRRSNSAI